jgi:hypothetical protein
MKFASFFILILISGLVEASVSWRGHNRVISSRYYDNDWNSSFNQSLYNHRSEVLWNKDQWSLELAYEIFLSRNNYLDPYYKLSLNTDPFSYRFDDLNKFLAKKDLYQDKSWQILQNLDRFFITYTAEHFDLFIGRQAINFGSARMINPTNVLVPFDLVMINMEQINGIDGIRGRVSLGELSEIDLGLISGEKAGFISYKNSFSNWDTSFLFLLFNKNTLYGLDLQGSIGGVGTWFETAWVDLLKNEDSDYLTISVGGEYLFENEINVFTEYHHNGAGTNDISNYNQTKLKTPFLDGSVYLLGKNYISFGGSYPVTPLKIITMQTMYNVKDQSILLTPKLEWNFKSDYYLNLGGHFTLGKTNPKSEFGDYPQVFYLLLRHFF